MSSVHFFCAKQIRAALEMHPQGMLRADLFNACDYPSQTDENFGQVLNAMVQAGDIQDSMEEGGRHRYFSPRHPAPKPTPARAPAADPAPIRIVLAEERRQNLLERIRAGGHPVSANHIRRFGLYSQKTLIYPDLNQLVRDEVLERKDINDGTRLSRAYWWFKNETWPTLVSDEEDAAADARFARATTPAEAALPQTQDSVELSLIDSRDAAKAAITAYVDSITDKEVMRKLKQNLTYAETALSNYLQRRQAA